MIPTKALAEIRDRLARLEHIEALLAELVDIQRAAHQPEGDAE